MNRIKTLRLEKSWRQIDLAQRLNTKQQTVARYETGEREPDIATIGKLCEIFQCSADYLLGFSSVRFSSVTESEYSLIAAYRASDLHTRELVDLALAPFQRQEEPATDAG